MDIIGTNPDSQSAIDTVQQHVFFQPRHGQGWESKPELPTPEEILAKESDIDTLPENPVDVPWASKNEYLGAQYEILRREAIEGLRYSVRSFADHRSTQPMMDGDFTNVYTHVHVKEYLMTRVGPFARVSFSLERARFKITWKQSKRLQPGKLVALSPRKDGFRKICKIAVVAQRPYADGLDQDPPIVDLLWANPEDAVLDPRLEMVMIESLHGYFESARHALVGLQHAARTDSPIDKYLTGACTEDSHPAFLKEDPIMDLSALASRATAEDDDAVAELRSHDIINRDLPDLKDLTLLDESQLLGAIRIISNELAIVQGPPGTGKTFTSVEAIKTLVANRRRHRGPPILVAAQTNHALDQILVHCINAGAQVLRMGGRTQTEMMKQYTLFDQRLKCGNIPADSKSRSVEQDRQRIVRKMKELVDALFSQRFLDPDALLEADIITKAQHQSLCDQSMETHQDVDDRGPFALWLGASLIPAKVREDRHPTQGELNEALARKNLPEVDCDDDEEVENTVDDEDDAFRFHGQRILLKYEWSGRDPANLTSWDRAVQKALRNDDLFEIDPDLRGAVYQHFQAKLLEATTPKFAAMLTQNVELCKKRKAFNFLGNTQVVDQLRIDIVGCTTTGLSKYRGCLAAMQPQSLLIEEAAETREANIVSALYPSIKQLILVGDHKQLAPKCDIQRLGDPPYNLNVSLFQRLVNLNMPFVMLKQQRRMTPELRYILSPFYPELYDHPAVKCINNRPDVLGMGGRNCWLFDHTWPEDVNANFSKYNEQEAEMIANFFAYLMANGTPADKITVLTFYKGQRKVLLNKLRCQPTIPSDSAFQVCTVDSYQGEENDIILLSLVRSPQMERAYAVGFLEDERRAVVAISRARRGFYLFGNVDNVLGAHQTSHDLWSKICYGFAAQGRIERDRGLPLVCQPHGREIWIKEVEDWGDNSGGCDLPCGQTRPCGHPCTLKCHALRHENLGCAQPCPEKLPCGHGCQRCCGQKCFCDCAVFAEIERQTQAAAQQHQSLEQKMLQMGAEETRMLMNSMSTSRQQAQPPPGIQGQPASTRGGKEKTVPKNITTAQAAQTAAQWGEFVQNINHHDEQLRLEHLATMGQQSSETVIREVHQLVALDDGGRVAGGSRKVREVQLPYNQVAAGFANSQSAQTPALQTAIGNLTLVSGSHRIGQGTASMKQPGQNSAPKAGTTTGQPSQTNGKSRRGGKASRKDAAKSAARQQANFPVQHSAARRVSAQQPLVQQPLAQQAPAQLPPVQPLPAQQPSTQSNPGNGGFLIDTTTQDEPSIGDLLPPAAGYTTNSHLLSQIGLLTPSPASAGGSTVSSETGQIVSTPTLATAPTAQVQLIAQTQLQAQDQANDQKNGTGGGGDGVVGGDDDEWLIEL